MAVDYGKYSLGYGEDATRYDSPASESSYSLTPKLVGGMPGFKFKTRFKKGGEAKAKKMVKGGKLTDLTGDGKVTRADVLKGRGVPGFAKGGTASKRADGCAQRGKTKGKMV
jgi:hypothetical protein